MLVGGKGFLSKGVDSFQALLESQIPRGSKEKVQRVVDTPIPAEGRCSGGRIGMS